MLLGAEKPFVHSFCLHGPYRGRQRGSIYEKLPSFSLRKAGINTINAAANAHGYVPDLGIAAFR